MSTVKKSQKRDLPFQLYQPPVVDADEEYDKENQPVSYESRFSRVMEPKTHESETMSDKRRATEPYRSVVADVDMDEEGSLTRQDSEYSNYWHRKPIVANLLLRLIIESVIKMILIRS